jgi:2-polyprenyl-6-methoxyphenol hydroxylase-like FAD-dependent oxidoreductase
MYRPGIRLIGDAAHLMAPLGGVGANLALEDKYKRGEAILGKWRMYKWEFRGREILSEAVEGLEKGMFPRAERVAGITMRMEGLVEKET